MGAAPSKEFVDKALLKLLRNEAVDPSEKMVWNVLVDYPCTRAEVFDCFIWDAMRALVLRRQQNFRTLFHYVFLRLKEAAWPHLTEPRTAFGVDRLRYVSNCAGIVSRMMPALLSSGQAELIRTCLLTTCSTQSFPAPGRPTINVTIGSTPGVPVGVELVRLLTACCFVPYMTIHELTGTESEVLLHGARVARLWAGGLVLPPRDGVVAQKSALIGGNLLAPYAQLPSLHGGKTQQSEYDTKQVEARVGEKEQFFPADFWAYQYKFNETFDYIRTYLIEALIACVSSPAYTAPAQYRKGRDILCTALCHESNLLAPTLYFSIVNLLVDYKPRGRLPYTGRLFAQAARDRLVHQSLQLLLICLDHCPSPTESPPQTEKSPPPSQPESKTSDSASSSTPGAGKRLSSNVFRDLLALTLNKKEDAVRLFRAVTRLLAVNIDANTTYLPGSLTPLPCFEELMFLMLHLLEKGRTLMPALCNSSALMLEVARPICFLFARLCGVLEEVKAARDSGPSESTDQAADAAMVLVNAAYVAWCVLVRLSERREFGIALNVKYESELPLDVDIAGSYHDLLILLACRLLDAAGVHFAAFNRLFLMFLNNCAPYMTHLAMGSAMRLVHLSKVFASTPFLTRFGTSELEFLVDSLNSILLFQHSTNYALVFAMVAARRSFGALVDLDLSQYRPRLKPQKTASTPSVQLASDGPSAPQEKSLPQELESQGTDALPPRVLPDPTEYDSPTTTPATTPTVPSPRKPGIITFHLPPSSPQATRSSRTEHKQTRSDRRSERKSRRRRHSISFADILKVPEEISRDLENDSGLLRLIQMYLSRSQRPQSTTPPPGAPDTNDSSGATDRSGRVTPTVGSGSNEPERDAPPRPLTPQSTNASKDEEAPPTDTKPEPRSTPKRHPKPPTGPPPPRRSTSSSAQQPRSEVPWWQVDASKRGRLPLLPVARLMNFVLPLIHEHQQSGEALCREDVLDLLEERTLVGVLPATGAIRLSPLHLDAAAQKMLSIKLWTLLLHKNSSEAHDPSKEFTLCLEGARLIGSLPARGSQPSQPAITTAGTGTGEETDAQPA